MTKTYTSYEKRVSALPRSKRKRQAASPAASQTTIYEGSNITLWSEEIDENDETAVVTESPIRIGEKLSIVDSLGRQVSTIGIDENGRFVFDRGIISKEDIIAYGVGGEDVKSVTDVIEEYLAEHGGGGYEPPVGGIPRSDLSSSVQASLGKADTALQEHQSLQGYATEQWVNGKGYLTAHQDISGKSNTTHTHSVKINGVTKTIAASGGAAVDLGTYLTAHQDISGKADKSSTVSTIAYDSTNKKITKTINGTTSDVVSVATLKSAMDAVTSTDLGNAISGEVQARINAINALDVASAGGSGKYIQSISQTDGKISATAATLNKSAVGLGNVDNTADANKNVASAIVANRLTTCKAYKNNANSYPWCLILSSAVETGSWSDRGGVYMIHNAYQGGLFGIFRVIMRTNNVDATSENEAQLTLQWIIKQSDGSNWDIKAGFKKTKKNAYVDVYYRSNGNYASAVITKLESSHRGVVSTGDFTMMDSNETTTEHTNCYASLGTQGAYRTYDMIVDCVHSANVGFANSANQLANTRTLWGQSFDGTGNVNGNILASVNDTSSVSVTTQNNNGAVQLLASTNRGLYDLTSRTWIVATNGTNTFLSKGNVGIGITSPSQKLHVAGNIRCKSYLEFEASDGTRRGYIGKASENNNNIYINSDTNDVLFQTIQGNVGIGTLSPSYKLHVAGAIYSDTAIRTANNKPFASKLADGTDVNLLSINANNKVNVGNSSYLTDVNGSTITLYNSATEKVTVTGGRLMATGTIGAVGGTYQKAMLCNAIFEEVADFDYNAIFYSNTKELFDLISQKATISKLADNDFELNRKEYISLLH